MPALHGPRAAWCGRCRNSYPARQARARKQMTESQMQEDSQAAGDETGRAVDEPARTAPDSDNDDGNARSAGGRGRAVAWFALLIALGAAAAAGYPHLEQWLGASPDEPATSALAARIDRLEAR